MSKWHILVYSGMLKVNVCNDIGGDFPIDVPKPKYWRGYVPGIPGGVDASATAAARNRT